MPNNAVCHNYLQQPTDRRSETYSPKIVEVCRCGFFSNGSATKACHRFEVESVRMMQLKCALQQDANGVSNIRPFWF